MNKTTLFKPALLSLAVASAMFSNIASAQEAAAEGEEVVVTGIRASLMRA